jgi:uncharacterized membrane-anchored protein YhcB (DUF1043 family)
MFKKVFSTQVLASLALIIGLVAGYAVNDYLTAPQLEELEQKTAQLEELQSEYNQLQEDYETLEENFTDLRQDYETLQATTVSASQYNSVVEDNQELREENHELEENLGQVQQELVDTNIAKEQLQSEYTKLLEKYNEIRVLSWTFFIVDNIEVNLTTAKNEYNSIEDILGTMEISYLNGDPFNGTFSLLLWSDYYVQGTPSDVYTIYGETDYIFEEPFLSQTGSYSLRVREIKDAEGNVIAAYSDLLNYSIPIQLG